ncbi:Psmd7: 26S proteasome non-ATPase regulatory subunit 7 [Crotalus adamanteus]|uniref:Psmd7: 26S proteasome non-ATPase regulatory subunit 7 n=1 Tax=Crotalus adamanteus TaxID=8729 RepID=A0AAW1BLE0_CROAD
MTSTDHGIAPSPPLPLLICSVVGLHNFINNKIANRDTEKKEGQEKEETKERKDDKEKEKEKKARPKKKRRRRSTVVLVISLSISKLKPLNCTRLLWLKVLPCH